MYFSPIKGFSEDDTFTSNFSEEILDNSKSKAMSLSESKYIIDPDIVVLDNNIPANTTVRNFHLCKYLFKISLNNINLPF